MRKKLWRLVSFGLIASSVLFFSGSGLSISAPFGFSCMVYMLGFLGCMLYRGRHNQRITFGRILSFRIALGHGVLWGVLLALSMALSFFLYFGKNGMGNIILLILMICYANCLKSVIDLNTFASIANKTFAVITILALILHCVRIVFGFELPCLIYASPNNGMVYKSVGVYNWLSINNRFMGPFSEPGVFCSMAVYALILELYYVMHKPRYWLVAILIIGIIASQSTAGYLLLTVMFYLYFSKGKTYGSMLDTLVMSVAVFFFAFKNVIFEKLYQLNSAFFWKIIESNVSRNTRLLSPLACCCIFLKNPITGVGISYMHDLYRGYMNEWGMDAMTSTSGYMMAAFGLSGLLYTVLWIYAIWRQRRLRVGERIILLVLILMIINKEPHNMILITYYMLFCFCDENSFDRMVWEQ